MIRLFCSHCNSSVEVDDFLAGVPVSCPTCRQQMAPFAEPAPAAAGEPEEYQLSVAPPKPSEPMAVQTYVSAEQGETVEEPSRAGVIKWIAASIVAILIGVALAAWVLPQFLQSDQVDAKLAQAERRRAAAEQRRQAALEEERRAAQQKAADEAAAKQEAEAAAAAERAKRTAVNQQAVPLSGTPVPEEVGSRWVDANTHAVQQGDARVRVSGLAFVNEQCRIELALHNVGKQPIAFRAWSTPDQEIEPRLLDDKGKACERIPHKPAKPGAVSVPPGGTASDRITFSTPSRQAAFLRLELSAEAFAGTGKLRLELPRMLIVLLAAPDLGEAVLAELKDILRNDLFAENRHKAALALERMGNIGRAALDDLVRATRDTSPLVRASSIRALAKLDSKFQHYKGIVRSLEDGDPQVRAVAIEALIGLGPPPAAELDTVLGLLQNPESRLRRYAVMALSRMNVDNKIAGPRFLEASRDADRDVRLAALEALVKARLPDPAIPALLEMLNGASEEDAKMAASILLQVETFRKQHLPGLLKALASKSDTPRQLALAMLGRMGAEGGEAVPALLLLLKEDDAKVQVQVLTLIPKLGPEGAKAAGPVAELFVKTTSAELRAAAASALMALGPTATGAVPALLQALKYQGLAPEANKILIKIGKGAVPQIMAALNKTNDLDDKTRLIDLLGQMGPEASQASVLLTNIAVTDFPRVRKAAKEALAKIQGK